jgi:hypothetical protein
MKIGLPITRNFRPFEVFDRLDRLFGVVEAARACIHPAQRHQPGIGIRGDLVEQFLSDRAVHHFFGMRHVLEQEGHVDDIDVVHDGSHRTCADAQHLDRANLGLLDGFLLAAELHRGKHLYREPPIGGGLEFLAEILGRHHRRVTGGLNVGCLENGFGLRARRR